MPLYFNNFSKVLSDLLEKTGVTPYKIAQYTGIDQGYISRLRIGKKTNPGPEVVVRLSLALVHFNDKIEIYDIEELFQAIGRSLFK